MHSDSDDANRPKPPVRAEYAHDAQQEPFLPKVPTRMDVPEQNTSSLSRQTECTCNYNRYATKKTISHGFLEFALLTSNAMQLRTLITQKQRDGIWIASLVLVCVSILAQIGLAFLLTIVGKGNIQNPQKQIRLERYNNLVLFITMLISIINVIINVFMSTTDPKNYLDSSSLENLGKNS